MTTFEEYLTEGYSKPEHQSAILAHPLVKKHLGSDAAVDVNHHGVTHYSGTNTHKNFKGASFTHEVRGKKHAVTIGNDEKSGSALHADLHTAIETAHAQFKHK
jgi:hypothetical protein